MHAVMPFMASCSEWGPLLGSLKPAHTAVRPHPIPIFVPHTTLTLEVTLKLECRIAVQPTATVKLCLHTGPMATLMSIHRLLRYAIALSMVIGRGYALCVTWGRRRTGHAPARRQHDPPPNPVSRRDQSVSDP